MHLCLFVAFSGAHHAYIKLLFFMQAAQKTSSFFFLFPAQRGNLLLEKSEHLCFFFATRSSSVP